MTNLSICIIKEKKEKKMTLKNIIKNKVMPYMTVGLMTMGGSDAGAAPNLIKKQNLKENNTEEKVTFSPEKENTYSQGNPDYERGVKCNINTLVKKRADWICREYVTAASRRLDEIRRCRNKNIYVKKMFARMGHGYKYGEYCLVAQLSAFKDVTDKAGNLQNVMPKTAGCSTFIQSLRNKGYGDCIRTSPAFKTMHAGDMVFIPRGKGKYHAVSVKKVWKDEKGKYHVLLTSFNNDHYYELTTDKPYIVVDMHKLTEKSLWKELDSKGYLPSGFQKGDVVQVLPLDTYKNIVFFLSIGMKNGNIDTAENQNNPEDMQVAVNLNFVQAVKNNARS